LIVKSNVTQSYTTATCRLSSPSRNGIDKYNGKLQTTIRDRGSCLYLFFIGVNSLFLVKMMAKMQIFEKNVCYVRNFTDNCK
jgi:hypothetical protein